MNIQSHQNARRLTVRSMILVALWGLLLLAETHADKISLVNGQTLTGIIKSENPYNVVIDIQGTRIPVPRERIKDITKNTLDENVRILLDRSFEALSRNEVPTARVLIEQARILNSQDPAIADELTKLDQNITDMERRGGTPEERRRNAERLLVRAEQAYDKIQLEQGNSLLIQALRSDPTFEPAHKKINELLLNKDRPDYRLAAEYFAEVLWPKLVQPNSPVLPLLPRIYAELISQFEGASDPAVIEHLADLLRVLAEAFSTNQSWKSFANDETTQALLETPLREQLLPEIIANNIKNKNYSEALAKLKTFAHPDDSSEIATLYIRANIGKGDFEEALKLMRQAQSTSSRSVQINRSMGALVRMNEAFQSLNSGDQKTAIDAFDNIFATRSTVFPEIGNTVGRQLALLKGPQLESMLITGPAWRAADIAVLIYEYSSDLDQRAQGAKILGQNMAKVAWRMEVALKADEVIVNLPESMNGAAGAKAAPMLGLAFDQQSPFIIRLTLDTHLNQDLLKRLQDAINNNVDTNENVFEAVVDVQSLDFELVARHQAIPPFFRTSWSSTELPTAVAQRREAAGDTAHKQAAPIMLKVQTLAQLEKFIMDDLADYLTSDVTNLTDRMNLPVAPQGAAAPSNPAAK